MTTHFHLPANDPGRRKWQDPEAILNEIGLQSGQTFADIGCGQGFFTLPAARIVGETGRVFGLDSDAHSINELQKVARREGLKNIELFIGKAEATVICDSCADIVFFGIVLHDFDNPAKVLTNARKTLTPGGLLVNLDWKKEDIPLGPPMAKKFSEDKAARLIERAGFTVSEIKDSGKYHYLILAKY